MLSLLPESDLGSGVHLNYYCYYWRIAALLSLIKLLSLLLTDEFGLGLEYPFLRGCDNWRECCEAICSTFDLLLIIRALGDSEYCFRCPPVTYEGL